MPQLHSYLFGRVLRFVFIHNYWCLVFLFVGRTHNRLLEQQAPGVVITPHDANGRCLSNMVWSLVKLGATQSDGPHVALQLIDTATPLVMITLSQCTAQALSNILWSYANLSTAYPAIMVATLQHLVVVLRNNNQGSGVHPQALSCSVWAVSQVGPEQPHFIPLSTDVNWQLAVQQFLPLVIAICANMLHSQRIAVVAHRLVLNKEDAMTCQVRSI